MVDIELLGPLRVQIGGVRGVSSNPRGYWPPLPLLYSNLSTIYFNKDHNCDLLVGVIQPPCGLFPQLLQQLRNSALHYKGWPVVFVGANQLGPKAGIGLLRTFSTLKPCITQQQNFGQQSHILYLIIYNMFEVAGERPVSDANHACGRRCDGVCW